MDQIFQKEILSKMISLRRELHRNPELSWEEYKTGETICRLLQENKIPYKKGLAKTGIVVDLPGPPNVPFVALRADMDALPIEEETGLEFSSIKKGVMHACGHDGHTAMLFGAALLLQRENNLPTPVRLIFQPAEEKGTGALAMISEGILDGVGMIFGGHLDRHYKTGTVIVTDGSVNASSDRFIIEIIGQGAHGARPHESIDSVVVGSLMVMALQTIVSREVDPAHPSVVSVGRFEAGTAPNVIAGQARLEGTVRAQNAETRNHLINAIRRIAQSIGQLHGAKTKVHIQEGTPPLLNKPDITDLARQAAVLTVGKENVLPLRTANMGGEDFSYYLEKVSGAYVRFGSQIPGLEGYPAHSSRFDFDEEALSVGANFFHSLVKIAGKKLSDQTFKKTFTKQ